MLAPNKQNLLLLKKQRVSVSKGLKLLQEKQAGLIIAFLQNAREGKSLESDLSTQINAYLQSYRHMTALTSYEAILELITRTAIVNIIRQKKRISGVIIDTFEIKNTIPERLGLLPSISNILAVFSHFIPDLTRVIQLRTICTVLAKEIKKVNRQIAMIQKQKETISQDIQKIQSILQERSNLEKATLIQLFN